MTGPAERRSIDRLVVYPDTKGQGRKVKAYYQKHEHGWPRGKTTVVLGKCLYSGKERRKGW